MAVPSLISPSPSKNHLLMSPAHDKDVMGIIQVSFSIPLKRRDLPETRSRIKAHSPLIPSLPKWEMASSRFPTANQQLPPTMLQNKFLLNVSN